MMKNWHMFKVCIFVGALAPLAGCATSPEQCDPNRGGFIHSTGCLASGAYDQRQQALGRELEEERATNWAFRNLLASIEREQQRVQGQLARRQSDYAAIDQAWRTLRANLDERGRQNQRLAGQIQSVDSDIAQLKRPTGKSGDSKQKQQRLEDLRRRVSLLQREIEAGIY